MKRIKLIIALFLATVTVTSFAQSSFSGSSSKFTLGIFGGLNIPRLSGGSNNALTSGYTSREGAAFGFTSNLDMGSHFSLRTDLLYSSEGGKRDGYQALSPNPQYPGTYLYATVNNESILNYLELPVMLKYSIPVKSSNFYIDFGPYAGYLLKAAQKFSGSGGTIYAEIQGNKIPVSAGPPNSTTDTKNSIHKMSFGLTGGIGYAQEVGKDQLVLDVRGAYSLSYVQKYAIDGNSHSGYLQISLGYVIPL